MQQVWDATTHTSRHTMRQITTCGECGTPVTGFHTELIDMSAGMYAEYIPGHSTLLPCRHDKRSFVPA